MSSSYPVVKTKSGSVKGISRKTDAGKLYYSFQGIPYVQTPTGEFRFKDPRPVQPWSETLDCTKEGPKCYHFDTFRPEGPEFVGSDDALGVNIFTPNLKPWRPLPVCVWIHGGGFVVGSSSTELYGPDYIVEKDVIMVSFNYRLGIFGFLSLKDPKLGIPGNAGLKDQSMALKWIKDNISLFGGNPNNITIFGESAGGASVHYQLISPMSKGLFNKAVSLSGSIYSPWASAPKFYPDCLQRLATALQLTEDADEETIFKAICDCEPMQLLIHDATLIKPEERLTAGTNFSVFVPQVEPYVSEMCFLPSSLSELAQNAWSFDMDVIFGGCESEGLLYNGMSPDEAGFAEIHKNNSYLLPLDLYHELGLEKGNGKGKMLKDLYFGDKDIALHNINDYLSYLTEATFWHGIFRAAVLDRKNANGKTFLYNLNISPSTDVPEVYKLFRSFMKIEHLNGTAHAEDIPLLFKTKIAKRFNKGDDNYEAQQVFLHSFVEFFKKGDPNYPALKQKVTQVWEPLPKGQTENVPSLEICRDEVRVQQLSKYDKIKVWNGLYDDKQQLML